MVYVIYTEIDGEECYWTGDFAMNGNPKYRRTTDRARKFSTARAAYEDARIYETLQDWRVGRRELERAAD